MMHLYGNILAVEQLAWKHDIANHTVWFDIMNLVLMLCMVRTWISISKYGRQRMVKYFNANEKLVTSMTCMP